MREREPYHKIYSDLSHCSGSQAIRCQQFYCSVVVRNAAGIETSCGNQDVDFRPMRLQRTRLDAVNLDPALKLSQFIAQRDGLAITQAQTLGIFTGHEYVITPCASDGINFRIDDAVELLAATRGQKKPSSGNPLFRQINTGEMRFAIGCETTVHQQSRPAILEVVAFLRQTADSLIGWAYAVNLIADVLCVLPGEKVLSTLRFELVRHQHRNLPFVPGFRNIWPAGNLRTINDPALGAGFRAV